MTAFFFVEEVKKTKKTWNKSKWTVETIINRPLHTARFEFFSWWCIMLYLSVDDGAVGGFGALVWACK